MAFPWPKHAVRPEMLLGGAKTLAGMAADGTIDFGPVAAGAPHDFTVFRGVHEFATDTVITRNIRFEQGGMIKPIGGARVEIQGRCWAEPTQQIFDISDGEVVGTFNHARSPCWWGAVGDYDGTDGTNNYAAFVACAQASHYRAGVRSRVVVPTGNFFAEGPVLPAIENPAWGLPGQPQHLSEAGIIQMYTGDVWEGESMGSSYITVGNGSAGAGYFVSMGGADSSGPPTVVQNLFIVGELGGAYALAGAIGAHANGAFVEKNWVNGFVTGLLKASTDQFTTRCVFEYCATAVQITRGHNNLSDCTMYLCGSGVVVDPADDQGVTILSDLRINNRNGGLSGGYGVIATGLYAQVKMSNIDVEAAPGGGEWTYAFSAYYAPLTQWVNCHAKIVGDHPAFSFAFVPEAQIVNCGARQISGTSNSAALHIHSGSTSVSVTQFKAKGAFKDGCLIDTAGRDIKLLAGDFSGATRNGLRVLRATSLQVTHCSFLNNAEAGVYDQIAAGEDGTHLYTAITADRGGAGTQAWGIVTNINNVNGRFVVSGSCSVLDNGTGAISHTGAYNPANNNTKIKIGAEVLVA